MPTLTTRGTDGRQAGVPSSDPECWWKVTGGASADPGVSYLSLCFTQTPDKKPLRGRVSFSSRFHGRHSGWGFGSGGRSHLYTLMTFPGCTG